MGTGNHLRGAVSGRVGGRTVHWIVNDPLHRTRELSMKSLLLAPDFSLGASVWQAMLFVSCRSRASPICLAVDAGK